MACQGEMDQAVARVERATRDGQLMGPGALFGSLQKFVKLPESKFKELVEGQAGIARAKGNWGWMDKARKDALFFFGDAWINQHLPKKSGATFKRKVTPEQPFYQGGHMCKDIRYSGNVQEVPATAASTSLKEVSASIPSPEARPSNSALREIQSNQQIPQKRKSAGSSGMSGSGVGESSGPLPKVFRSEATVPARSTKQPVDFTITLLGTGVRQVETEEGLGLSKRTQKRVQFEASEAGSGIPPSLVALPAGKGGRPGSKFSSCPVCGKTSKTIRRHVMGAHLPSILRDGESDAQIVDLHFNALRAECLKKLSAMALGPTTGLKEAQQFLNSRSFISVQSEIKPRTLRAMEQLCVSQTWPIPAQFKLYPLNSVACLIHWRPLSLLLALLSETEREEFRSFCSAKMDEACGTGSCPEAAVAIEPEQVVTGFVDENRPVSPPQLVSTAVALDKSGEITGPFEAFDSHFHLDRTAVRVLGNRGIRSLTLTDLLDRVMAFKPSQQSHTLVDLAGMVAVFCDPETYPGALTADPRMKYAIGIHPKKAGDFSEKHFCAFRRLLSSPGTVALGEVGLDWTEPESTWPGQEGVLRRVLLYSCLGQALVLHLRGRAGGDYSVYHRGLEIVKEYCKPCQPIHLHCFGGDAGVVSAWSDSFKNCFFGFTAAVTGFAPDQVSALRAVPLERLLVETDSPYLSPFTKGGGRRGKSRINTPRFIGDVGRLVAELRGMDLKTLLESTCRNGLTLYSSPTS